MTSFIKVKEALKAFYGRFDFAIMTLVKFIVAFAAMRLMADRLGYFDILTNKYIVPMVALICSILPWGLSTVILAICLLMHIYKASLEIALLVAFILIAIALLYYGFQPGHAELLVITPILFALKLPCTVVFVAGLSCGLYAIVPISVGVLVYSLTTFVRSNAGFGLGDAELTEIPGRIMGIVESMLTNKEMWKVMALFAFVLIIVFIIHNFSFDYSRYIALGVGAIFMFVGAKLLKVEISILALIISLLIAAVYNFVVFSVDYKGSERLEFEDDEYVYYVKAIPKLSTEYFKNKGKKKTVRNSAARTVNKLTEKQTEKQKG